MFRVYVHMNVYIYVYIYIYLSVCVCVRVYVRPVRGHARGISGRPSTQDLRLLVPKAIPLMDFGSRVLRYCVLGPPGIAALQV